MTLAFSRLRTAGSFLLDALLPRACVSCDRMLDERDAGPACGRCWSRVRLLPHPRCDRCGHPLRAATCRWCELWPPYVRAVRSVCWLPGGTGGRIVHALKYGGWPRVAEGMAERMARLSWPQDVMEERAAVVAVPLAVVRERERGFNQSSLLARAVARRWRVREWRGVLVRSRATATQTRLTPEGRRRNVSGAFAVPSHARRTLVGAHVVLVDDVVTTGATAVECASALLDGGARIISLVTFGRAPALGDPA